MDLGRRGDASCIDHKLANTVDLQRVLSRQQMSQRIGHGVLTFPRGNLQNLHVHFVGHFLRMRRSQDVPRHAKTACRKHLFAILITGKRSRFSYQRINNVAIVNGRLILADDSRHRLDQMAMMSHRDLFGSDAKIDKLAYQPTWHRVRVGPHIDRAAATDANPLDDVVGVEHRVWQRPQMGGVIEKLLSTIRVGSFDQIFHEVDVGFASIKVATAAQHQRLIDAIFEMTVGRFHVAVLIRTSRVGSFGFAVVVTHQCRVAFGEFTLAGVISNGSSQRIAAMPLRDTAEFPERLLNAGT